MRLRPIVMTLPLLLLAGCAEYVEGETKGSAGLNSSTSEGSTDDTADTIVDSSTDSDSGATTGSGTTTAGTATTTTTSAPTTGETTTTATTSTTTTTTTDSDATTAGTDSSSTTDAGCVDNAGCLEGICVDGECVMPASCLDILNSDAAAADGPYMIDVDGEGSEEPFEVQCDMVGGGWTCVYFNDFEANSDGWSKGDITSCDGTQILGGYDKLGKDNPVSRTFDLYWIPHIELRLNFTLVAIDSWDDELFRVELDGEAVWSKKCAYNNSNCNQSNNLCGNGIFDDGFLPVEVIVGHEAPDVSAHFIANLDEGRKNESFGLDDVRVCVK